jgi:hypothetical protein
MFFSKGIFMFPSGFLFGVVTPLYLAEFDGFGACSSFCCLEYLDGFLLIGQVTL